MLGARTEIRIGVGTAYIPAVRSMKIQEISS